MTKKLLLTTLTLLTAIIASAQHRESENILEKIIWNEEMLHIALDTRMDLRSVFNDEEFEELGFRGQTLRLWLAGQIVPGIRYQVVHRFNKPQDPMIRDNYSNATDVAWLSFDAGKSWTITVGKQAMQLGTFEYDYSGADIYHPSMVNGDIDLYQTGINAAYKFDKQTINLQIVNSDAPQFASEEYKNKALALNLMWDGNLFADLLKTRCGYGAYQHNKSKFYHWLTLGFQLNLSRFTSELDYFLGNRNMEYGSIVSDENLGNRYVKDQSVSLNFKYNLGKWHPFIKGTWDKRYDQEFGSNAYEAISAQAVVEYYPFTKPIIKNLRFHLAYVYSRTDYQGEFSSLGEKDMHQVLVGTRWLFKVK